MSSMQNDLIKTMDRIAEDHCQKATRDAAEHGEWPANLWASLEDVGLTSALVPESLGGSGLDFEDAMITLRRSAYHAMPVPLAETMLASRLLSQVGLEAPSGAITLAPAYGGSDLRIARSDHAAYLTGIARRVPWGNQCAHIVVALQDGDQAMIGLAELDGSSAALEWNLAGEPRAQLKFEHVPVKLAPLALSQRRMQAEGALIRSVQLAGALERALEYSIQYANERITFGRPIAKFQAVQQMLAVLAGQVAAACACTDMAVEASHDAANEFAAAVAKARAGEAAGKSAEIAHQVHGAMGFTHEHSLHYITRRLWSWRDEFGNETYWQTLLGRMAAAAGPQALWPMLTDMPDALAG